MTAPTITSITPETTDPTSNGIGYVAGIGGDHGRDRGRDPWQYCRPFRPAERLGSVRFGRRMLLQACAQRRRLPLPRTILVIWLNGIALTKPSFDRTLGNYAGHIDPRGH